MCNIEQAVDLPATNSRRIRIVCSRCGSDDCGRDATARWNLITQEWEISGIFDNSWCDACGTDDPGLLEVEITDQSAPTSNPDSSQPGPAPACVSTLLTLV